MALLIDGDISSINDLLKYESSTLDVANTEGIDLAAKLEIAETAVRLDIEAFLKKDYSNSGGYGGGQPSWKTPQVVITEGLRVWHVYGALAAAFRDAYHTQLNDRYQARWKTFEELAAAAKRTLFDIGVGVVFGPLRRPERPALSEVAGAQAAATWCARITWVTENGVESAASAIASLTTDPGSALVVAPPDSPEQAAAYNVYVGLTQDQITLQNDTPVSLESTWTMPNTGLTAGTFPPDGQQPDRYLLRLRRF